MQAGRSAREDHYGVSSEPRLRVATSTALPLALPKPLYIDTSIQYKRAHCLTKKVLETGTLPQLRKVLEREVRLR